MITLTKVLDHNLVSSLANSLELICGFCKLYSRKPRLLLMDTEILVMVPDWHTIFYNFLSTLSLYCTGNISFTQ